jgi:hypothetical protein
LEPRAEDASTWTPVAHLDGHGCPPFKTKTENSTDGGAWSTADVDGDTAREPELDDDLLFDRFEAATTPRSPYSAWDDD